MEGSSRDRSPLRHPAAANIGFMPSFVPTDDTTALHSNLAQDSTNTYSDPSFATTIDQNQYFGESSFDVYSQPVQQPAGLGLDDIASLTYNAAIPDHLSPHSLSNHTSPAPEGFPNLEYTDTLDSTLVNELDLLQQPGLNYTNNPLDSMSATMNTHNPTPPHLLPQMGRKSSSPSPRATPSQSPFLQRQRNTSESLDPSSAQYLSQNVDWAHVQGHRGHRRMHSDNLSDISSHSAQASPYLPTMDSFDQNHASPMLNPQDPAFSDGLGIGQFTIGDNRSYSPAVSPHISPRLGAQQQPLPQFTSADGFGLNAPLGGTYAQPNGLDAFAQEAFPSLSRGASPGETGMEHMSPPEFKIDLAPPIKPFETSRPSLGDDTLGLPSPRGNRARAKSDSSARPMTPSFQAVSNPSSREPSPARGRNGSLSGRYRSTSATSDQREYILDLADPQRSPSTGDNKRQQKHPATFQCHLCPKRFTRAYNLRSHLRTHTDERPFVCTVCDKAFARQHDRKRHESLHSGEKKFVCRGQLKNGGSWGCSRRFARADALGRHFRSEAGRVCIKPLLEEEAVERRQALWQEQQAQVAAGYPVVEPQLPFFPAAILQQYPALAGFDWNQPQTNIPEEEYAGRSSFDASSGGEMYDEVSENEMGIGSMSVNGGYGLQPQHQMNSYSGHQMGDFTNGFEGR
ncbi:hypothetical protein AMS68_002482 [Peltaster fructicola]|uniref:C2H2-type domain-containing protein n=1 Tax=Peltaster fructicola TaxID=286661 RepID=A0A6H0XQQ5_9PEZI|nr:hypothetical protein AMS68_002482 [Peltaster fructicola]